MTVDLKRFNGEKENLQPFSKPYIAYIGVMNDAKDGVNILINAFNIIKNKYSEHKVYLIGSWNYDTPGHQQMIKENSLSERVFWMKEYQRDQIPNIICNADLLVLPRPDSKQARGGFPTKLGEYLATGIPVCATRVGEIPDYLQDNESVFFADPGSSDSFAKALDRALSDSINAKRIGQNGKKVAETYFNKDIQVKVLYDFFQELIKNDPK
jgi:glycosyltransferase involved in cell wall biosynthesis